MSKENNTANEKDLQRRVIANGQYIKDLSLENPGAPASLMPSDKAPDIAISVDVKINRLDGNVFEVSLIIGIDAKREDKSLFIIELDYSGVFTVDLPEQEQEPVLMVYCTGLLFPFARRIVADISRDGGFPPLMLDPIDFTALYHHHKQKEQAEGKKEKAS